MASIQSREIVKEILTKGKYSDDPPPLCLWQYTTPEGGANYMLGLHPIDVVNMLDSPYCENEVLLWDLKNGLAIEGINWLAQEKENG